jgi:hypothetical protein
MQSIEFLDFDSLINDIIGIVDNSLPLTAALADNWLHARHNTDALLIELARLHLQTGLPSTPLDFYMKERLQKMKKIFVSFKNPEPKFMTDILKTLWKANPALLEFHAMDFYPKESVRFHLWHKIKDFPCPFYQNDEISPFNLSLRRIKNLDLSSDHTYQILSTWLDGVEEQENPLTQKKLLCVFWNSAAFTLNILGMMTPSQRIDLATRSAFAHFDGFIEYIEDFQLTLKALHDLARLLIEDNPSILQRLKEVIDFPEEVLADLEALVRNIALSSRNGNTCQKSLIFPRGSE